MLDHLVDFFWADLSFFSNKPSFLPASFSKCYSFSFFYSNLFYICHEWAKQTENLLLLVFFSKSSFVPLSALKWPMNKGKRTEDET